MNGVHFHFDVMTKKKESNSLSCEEHGQEQRKFNQGHKNEEVYLTGTK